MIYRRSSNDGKTSNILYIWKLTKREPANFWSDIKCYLKAPSLFGTVEVGGAFFDDREYLETHKYNVGAARVIYDSEYSEGEVGRLAHFNMALILSVAFS